MRLLLCGGGTAGHVNPAIAIAEEIRSRDKNSSFLFIGREGGRENELITKAGFEVKTIKIEGLRRSLSSDNIRRIIYALKARSAAEKIIKDFKPDIVFGTGGYVCWPVITAAKALGIKTAIHESNVSPGITTKMVSGKCDMIFLNHEKTKDYLGRRNNSLVVGNPLRHNFGTITREDARRRLKIKDNEFFILSFGGSIGAQRLNDVILEVIEEYSSKNPRVKHMHAMGKRYYKEGEKKYIDRPVGGCRIVSYINDMATAMKAADIVISRCGAITLSEISASQTAAILIPSPNVSDNHQYKNAKLFSDAGAASLIEEKNLSAERLICEIKSLENDEIGRKNRAKIIGALYIPGAEKTIADKLFSLNNLIK